MINEIGFVNKSMSQKKNKVKICTLFRALHTFA